MSTTTSQAKSVRATKGPIVEMPAKARFQPVRAGVGLVIPKPLLQYYGLVNTDRVHAEISIAERGYYVKLVHEEGAFD